LRAAPSPRRCLLLSLLPSSQRAMKPAMHTVSKPPFSAWQSIVSGFLFGFLCVLGWQSGAYQEHPIQESVANLSATASRAMSQANTDGAKAALLPSLPEVGLPIKAAETLLFQPRYVEQQLKGPLGRLEKFLQERELKAAKSQQVGARDGDTIVRIETGPFKSADVESFWEKAEQELMALKPGVQSFYLARVQDMKEAFFGQRQSGVLFVKQSATRIRGEPSVQYWFFQTAAPSQYKLSQDGSISVPANETLPQAVPWFDPSTYKPPQRLKHLAIFKYD
jgi:hypothetical protein